VIDDDPRSDQQLVQAVNAGDPAAFEAIYARYRDWVVRLAMRFTHDADDARDVLQDTFLFLLGKFPGFRLSSRLTTYLYPAVRHLAITRRERRARLLHTSLPDKEPVHDDPAPFADADLATVLAGLPEHQREVLLMRVVDDMSLAEIASVLAIPLGTVKSRLHLAVSALRADPKLRQYFTD
jgi:RNA polymerase sigma-70 factor (ECF subfamily)